MATLELDRSTPTPELLTDVRGVAALLRRSPSSIWRDAAAGRMPQPLTIGTSKRWRIEELTSWVNDGCPDCRTMD